MYDLISNLEKIDSLRPEMVASDWTASGNVEIDLRAHRLDAKNNLLKILEAKEKEVDDEMKNKEIESKRKDSWFTSFDSRFSEMPLRNIFL